MATLTERLAYRIAGFAWTALYAQLYRTARVQSAPRPLLTPRLERVDAVVGELLTSAA